MKLKSVLKRITIVVQYNNNSYNVKKLICLLVRIIQLHLTYISHFKSISAINTKIAMAQQQQMYMYKGQEYTWDEFRLQKFKGNCIDFEISNYFAAKLRQLEGYEIVLILDDSSSMGDPLKTGGTRWDEQKKTAKIIIDIASTMDPNGIDIYFLNRGYKSNVTDYDQVENLFKHGPSGGTPLCTVFRKALTSRQHMASEKKFLYIIGTDGTPSEGVDVLEKILREERVPLNNIYTTFVACTDIQSDVEHLNGWDINIPHVDVVDDYQSEKKEVIAVKGPKYPFSFGDYVVKSLIGSIDPEFDNLDERKSKSRNKLLVENREFQTTAAQYIGPTNTVQNQYQYPIQNTQQSVQVPYNDPIVRIIPKQQNACCTIL
jgi:hypothetical protein